MMSKTHVAMGIATSVAITHPSTSKECILSVIGGAVGGIICDIDTLKDDYKCDALIGQLSVVGITGILLLIDYFREIGICEYLLGRNRVLMIIGGILFAIPWIIGFFTEHRTFTHSFLALAAFSLSILLLCPSVLISFVIGFVTHILLDLLNKRDLRLLYPKEAGICLNLCYADEVANKVFLVIGLVASVFFILNCLVLHLF